MILNAAAYTAVDTAETSEGRTAAWKVNATAVGYLSAAAAKNDIVLVHISTDYVFDGTQSPHSETEDFSPISVYGSSKAAGDLLVAQISKHYIIRTSWVIGEGNNFVRTMLALAKKGLNPTVVSDQIGRLTFTSELVRAIDHLLTISAAFGSYNLSGDGQPESWANIARNIYQLAGLKNTITDSSTVEYYAGKTNIAPRPLQSTLDLEKIKSTGFITTDWKVDLKKYLDKETKK